MKNLTILILSVLVFACNSNPTAKTNDNEPLQPNPDFNVALKFINDYTTFCETLSSLSKDSTWIESNKLLTENFKMRYKFILDSAQKEEPEVGLDFDPIIDAQDFPDHGFELLSTDNQTGFLKVKGKDLPDFVITMKVVYQNGLWLVDGSGIVNIPKDKVARN